MIIVHENGKVIATMSGDYTNPAAVVADVPDGYEVTGVDIQTGEPILTPRPATEAERTAAIEKQMMAQAAGHAGTYEDPVPFVYGMTVTGGKYYSYGGEVYIWNTADSAACVWLPDSGIWEWQKAAAPGAGNRENPIPASRGMEYTYGLYYLDPEDGLVYLCTRAGAVDGETVTLQYLPHELVGQYFEVA